MLINFFEFSFPPQVQRELDLWNCNIRVSLSTVTPSSFEATPQSSQRPVHWLFADASWEIPTESNSDGHFVFELLRPPLISLPFLSSPKLEATGTLLVKNVYSGLEAEERGVLEFSIVLRRENGSTVTTAKGTFAKGSRTLWRNWASNIVFYPQQVLFPSSEEELRDCIQKAATEGKKIRPTGSTLSYTPLCETTDYLISLIQMRKVLNVNLEKKQVTAQGGILIWELEEVMMKNNLCLPTSPVIDRISIAGAVSNGVHGTGWNWPTLSELVVEMKFMSIGEDLKPYTWSIARKPEMSPEESEDFKAAVVSLGALGIILSITFQGVDLFWLENVDFTIPIKDFYPSLKQFVLDNEYVETFWSPLTDSIWMRKQNRVDERSDKLKLDWDNEVRKQYIWFLNGSGVSTYKHLYRLNSSTLTETVLKSTSLMAPNHDNSVTPAPTGFHYAHWEAGLTGCMDMSVAIPIDNLPDGTADFTKVIEAWDYVMRLTEEYRASHKYPLNMSLHARYLKTEGVEGFLAPTFGFPHSCLIEIITSNAYDPECYGEFFKKVQEKWVKELGGRPHWGKLLLDINLLKSSYDKSRIDAFKKVKRRRDPKNFFTNDFIEAVLDTSSVAPFPVPY